MRENRMLSFFPSRAVQAALLPSFLVLTSHLSSFFSPTGDIAQLQLPASMETLIITWCEKLTGAFLVFVPHSRAAQAGVLPSFLFLLTSYFLLPTYHR